MKKLSKTCNKCAQRKPITDFYQDGRSHDGRQRWCVECATEYRRARKKERIMQPLSPEPRVEP